MPIVGFEQDPNGPFGSGTFRDEAGRVTYLHDPDTASRFVSTMPGSSPAKAVAAQSTDIARGVMGGAAPSAGPDMRLALNDTGAPVPAGDPNMSVSDAPNMSVSPSPQQLVSTVGDATAAPATAGPAAAPSAAPQSKPQQLVNAVTKAAAPSAAVLPLAGVQTTQNRSVVKGASRAGAEKRVREGEQAQADVNAARLAAAQAKDTRTDQAYQQMITGTKAAGVEEFQNIADARAKEAEAARLEKLKREELAKNDKQLDPERVLRNMSTGKKVGMTILAALNGAFGALIGKKNNDVIDVIDQEIERDIQRQRDEIASGRVRIGNEIDRYVKMGFDAETAEKMARDRLKTAVMAVTDLEAKRLGVQGENAENARLMNEEQNAQVTRWRGEVMATTEDREQTNDQRTETRQAATPKASLDEALKQVQLQQAMLKLGNEKTATMNAVELSKQLFGVDEKGNPVKLINPDEAKDLNDKAAQLGPALAETAGAVNMTKVLIESLGGKLDVTTGKITWPEGGDVSGAGPVDVHGGYTGPLTWTLRQAGLYRADVDKVRDAQSALKEYVTSQLTGANSTLRQEQVFGAMVGGDLVNEGRVKENVENWTKTLFSTREAHMARLGPAGQRLVELNQRNAQLGNQAEPLKPMVVTSKTGDASPTVSDEPTMSMVP